MNIQLVTFDLDDTLWDVTQVMDHAEATLRHWLGLNAPRLGPAPLTHLRLFRDRLLASDPLLKYRLSELRLRLLEAALLDAGYAPVQASQLARDGFQVFLAARHEVQLFDGALTTLETLAQRYQLGVITNGNADVRRIGIGAHFSFTLCAEELGVGKPEALPFTTALSRAGVLATQAVHIGDHPVDDIAGAKTAGWRAIWINRAALPWADGPAPDGQVQQLSELPDLLDRLQRP